MSIFQSPDQIVALKNLLQPGNGNPDDSDTDNDESILANGKDDKKKPNETPGQVEQQEDNNDNDGGEKKNQKKKKKKSPYEKLEEKQSDSSLFLDMMPQSLEEWEQFEEKEAELLETRKCPEYTLTYRQAVGTEDVFLQMGNRTNATASCEDLLIDIQLPNDPTDTDKMELNISENEIILCTSVYFLKLPLPNHIDVDSSDAKFDRDLDKLTLKLRLKREYDFINF